MIKIIKKGTREIRECDNCGCLFSFDEEDILGGKGLQKYIKCPQCDYKVKILPSVTNKEPLNLAGVLVPDVAWCNNCKHFGDGYEKCNICNKLEYWEPQNKEV